MPPKNTQRTLVLATASALVILIGLITWQWVRKGSIDVTTSPNALVTVYVPEEEGLDEVESEEASDSGEVNFRVDPGSYVVEATNSTGGKSTTQLELEAGGDNAIELTILGLSDPLFGFGMEPQTSLSQATQAGNDLYVINDETDNLYLVQPNEARPLKPVNQEGWLRGEDSALFEQIYSDNGTLYAKAYDESLYRVNGTAISRVASFDVDDHIQVANGNYTRVTEEGGIRRVQYWRDNQWLEIRNSSEDDINGATPGANLVASWTGVGEGEVEAESRPKANITFNLYNKTELARHEFDELEVFDSAWSPNGRNLALTTLDQGIMLFVDGELVFTNESLSADKVRWVDDSELIYTTLDEFAIWQLDLNSVTSKKIASLPIGTHANGIADADKNVITLSYVNQEAGVDGRVYKIYRQGAPTELDAIINETLPVRAETFTINAYNLGSQKPVLYTEVNDTLSTRISLRTEEDFRAAEQQGKNNIQAYLELVGLDSSKVDIYSVE